MKFHKKWEYGLYVMALSLLLVVMQGMMDRAIVSAQEEDVFDILQIVRVPERIEVPDFSLTSIDGEKRNLSDYKGDVIFLNFWTTW